MEKKESIIEVVMPTDKKEQSTNMENFKLVFDANDEIRQELLVKAIKMKGEQKQRIDFISKYFISNFYVDFSTNNKCYTFEIEDSLGEMKYKMKPIYQGSFIPSVSKFATAENKGWYKRIKEVLPVELSPNVYLTYHAKAITFAQEISYFATCLGIENKIVHEGIKKLYNYKKKKEEEIDIYSNLLKIKEADKTFEISVSIAEGIIKRLS